MRLDEGRLLGDWKLIKEIGYSAVGYSFTAEHRFTKQKVIIKVLPQELSLDRSFIMRFEKEVVALSALDHPAIAKVHTVSHVDNVYILVSEHVAIESNGEIKTLKHIAKEHKLTSQQITFIARQLAEALDYAHFIPAPLNWKPFSHGNINPSNIFAATNIVSDVLPASSQCVVKLADFGLSRIIGQATWLMREYEHFFAQISSSETPNHSLIERKPLHREEGKKSMPFSSSSLGLATLDSPYQQVSPDAVNSNQFEKCAQTLAHNMMFLSPEQRCGNWTTPQESDVWSFGVLLYWLVTGSYPEGAWTGVDFTSSCQDPTLGYVIQCCLAVQPSDRPKKLSSLFDDPILHRTVQNMFSACTLPMQSNDHETFYREDAIAGVSSSALPHMMSAKRACSSATIDIPPLTPAAAANSIALLSSSQNRSSNAIRSSKEETKNIKEYIPEKRESKSIEPVRTDMVVISQENYSRGSTHGCRDELPRHNVRLNAFYIDIHPVTNEQFVRFLEFLGEEKDKYNHDMIKLRDSRIKKSAGKFVIERGYGKHPVVGVAWYGATAYAAWIEKRLPTEAEWEIACCGGLENHPYPTGEDIERSQANFFSSDTTPVMSYPPNGYGIYDMAGNVYEWCCDWYEYNYYDFSAMEPDNPKGPVQGVYRVLRGGCWKSLKEDLRSAKRHRNNPGSANGTYGFRCAKDVE